MSKLGLVTGSEPFAGLPDNPAQDVLAHIDGKIIDGIEIKAVTTPVSVSRLPVELPALIERHRPCFVVSLGLANGASTCRVETIAINTLDMTVPDNDGIRPADGRRIDPQGPAARHATWQAYSITKALLAEDLPACVSHHAGTHLCNATLYWVIAAMHANGLSGPCGFFHLPHSTTQVARLLREAPSGGDMAPLAPRDLPSMSPADQLRAVNIMLKTVAAQVKAGEGS